MPAACLKLEPISCWCCCCRWGPTYTRFCCVLVLIVLVGHGSGFACPCSSCCGHNRCQHTCKWAAVICQRPRRIVLACCKHTVQRRVLGLLLLSLRCSLLLLVMVLVLLMLIGSVCSSTSSSTKFIHSLESCSSQQQPVVQHRHGRRS